MLTGRVISFDADKGYGFVRPDDGSQDAFLHVSQLSRPSDGRLLRAGTLVSFAVSASDRGPRALNVAIEREDAAGEPHVLTGAEFQAEVREVADKALQPLLKGLEELARRHGWVA